MTKDGFSEEPAALWDGLSEACRGIVGLAEVASQNIELGTITRATESILSVAIGGKQSVKGSRPGTTGKRGTVESTGTGGEHRNFRTTQPGDKKADAGVRPANTPDRIRLAFDETIEGIFRLDSSGARGKSFLLTLNSSHPCVKKAQENAFSLATLCLSWVTHEIVDKSSIREMFPMFREMKYREVLQHFYDRLAAQHEDSPASRKRRRPAMAS